MVDPFRYTRLGAAAFEQVVHHSNDAVLIARSGSGAIVYSNPAAAMLLEHDLAALLAMAWTELLPENSKSEHERVLAAFVNGRKSWATLSAGDPFSVLSGLGEEVPVFGALTKVDLADGRAVAVTLRDGRPELRHREELLALTRTDSLSGLPNRRRFDEQLADEFARYKRYGSVFSVAYFDIDAFKAVNDRFGHQTGDEALRWTGQKVKKVIRRTDLFARIGGDEFALLLPETPLAQAHTVCQKLLGVLGSQSVDAAGLVKITASAGVTSVLAKDEAPEQLVARADAGLYRAKGQGGNRVGIVSD